MSAAGAGPQKIFVWAASWRRLGALTARAWRAVLDQLVDRWDRGVGPSAW